MAIITEGRLRFDIPLTMAEAVNFDIFKQRYSGPEIGDLDEAGRRIFFRGCDLAARLWLNELVMPEFDAKNFEGATMLIHAERYLEDRLAYELAPWPKGKVKREAGYELPWNLREEIGDV